MAYTTVKVNEYSISVIRSKNGSLRRIHIESPTPVSGRALDHVHLAFVHDPTNLGYIDDRKRLTNPTL